MIVSDLMMASRDWLSSGIYESFYFRGNHDNGKQAFWLKHNLLIPTKKDEVIVEATLIVFNKETAETNVLKTAESVSLPKFEAELKRETWNGFSFEFENGSSLSVTSDALKGRIKTEEGTAAWDLKLSSNSEVYYHFSHDWYYHGFFPKKKILTNRTRVEYEGTLSLEKDHYEGHFVGMNGHNWGKEHAPLYAYGDCNQFQENGKDVDAFFDGFSAKIKVAGMMSPFLSCASLRYGGEWFHFNKVLSSFKHQVSSLDKKLWIVAFVGPPFAMEVAIDGGPEAWVDLKYDHPGGKVSTVGNTKYATGTITLKKSGEVITTLKSSLFELETLLPD